MKKDKFMSSHGSLTTIIYGASFEDRKAHVEKLLNEKFPEIKLEKIVIDMLEGEYKVQDLRKIVAQTEYSSLRSGERAFIFYHSQKLTPLMQNMLLKTLEEPHAKTHFILEISSYHSLLSTIQSRSLLVKVDGSGGTKKEASEFPTSEQLVKSPIAEAFKLCETYSGDRETASQFISYITSHIRGLLVGKSLSEARQQRLVAFADFLLQCHEWITHTNVSPKTVLENAVLGYRHCLA